jgi:predicted aspartyl protease
MAPARAARTIPRRLALTLAMTLAMTGAALALPAEAACDAVALATVPLSTVPFGAGPGPWTVPLLLDGAPAAFVLDTGAERTVLSDAAVRRLGLPRDPWVSSTVGGVGGVEQRANAVTRSLTLGGVALRRPLGPPAQSLVVASLPWLERATPPIAGLLGADYLTTYDLEIDPAAPALTLHAVRGCAEPPWRVSHTALAAERPRRGVLLVPVDVDGVRLMAQLDTGAGFSLVSRRGAARLGWSETPPDRFAVGVGPQRLGIARRRVATLAFGTLVLRDLDLATGAPAGGFPFDMLLGVDVLRQRRFWVSYATNRVLVADS